MENGNHITVAKFQAIAVQKSLVKNVKEKLRQARQNYETFLMVHPVDRREEAGQIIREMLSGKAQFCPVLIITKSGDQIPVETRVTRGMWNEEPALFGVTKDISQIKLLVEKFSKVFYQRHY